MRKLLFSILILFCSVSIVFSNPPKPVTPETALQAYLHNSDQSFKWEIQDQTKTEGASLFRILFTSQQWRGISWKHEMIVMVPDVVKYQDALLFITGGSVKNGMPNTHQWDDGLVSSMSQIAKTNKTIAAIIWQVPNQPLYDDLTEDALISYTLHNYLNDHDFTWPLLFPMTKSAIRGMDVVQNFAKKELKKKVTHFVVSGASKRGWTTWLTGANDKRVKAICPMVIDVLNMPVNVDYQKLVWGDYSIEIEDYVKLGIAQQLGTAGGNDLTKMIDPYSYRKTLTMPKMIFMGTNDPYWPVDAIKNYIDSIPGDNHICYTPNAAHDLGDRKKAFTTLSAFLGTTVTNSNYPVCKYSISEGNGTITLKVTATPELFVDATIWSADSKDQDFRDETWSNTSINPTDKTEIIVEIKKPESGFKAFYVDLKYKAPFGDDYTQSTRMFVTTDQKLLIKNQ
ncbi:MAG: PhoPQ-activated pathogenicity-related family protein [Prolixibacteraceae bacterium]|nr:PhoPQ-activated pathogenicity-related family protein [Prolixibacteraceae bacterium]